MQGSSFHDSLFDNTNVHPIIGPKVHNLIYTWKQEASWLMIVVWNHMALAKIWSTLILKDWRDVLHAQCWIDHTSSCEGDFHFFILLDWCLILCQYHIILVQFWVCILLMHYIKHCLLPLKWFWNLASFECRLSLKIFLQLQA